MEPPNNGHSGDRPLVHCREVVPISEVKPCMLQLVGGNQFELVVCFSECPLSEVPLYTIILRRERKPWSDANGSCVVMCFLT